MGHAPYANSIGIIAEENSAILNTDIHGDYIDDLSVFGKGHGAIAGARIGAMNVDRLNASYFNPFTDDIDNHAISTCPDYTIRDRRR